jgi:hypothetical protein
LVLWLALGERGSSFYDFFRGGIKERKRRVGEGQQELVFLRPSQYLSIQSTQQATLPHLGVTFSEPQL